MPKSMRAFETHDFYCINCGKKGIPISRQNGHKREAFHRKWMYCPNCKHTVNHIECRTQEEKEQFMADFLVGKYQEEAALELAYEQEHPKYQNILKGLK